MRKITLTLTLAFFAAGALAAGQEAASISSLVEKVGGANEAEKYEALHALGDQGGKASSAISSVALVLSDTKASLNSRLEAAATLGKIGGKEGVAALSAALADGNPHLRAWAAKALGMLGPDAAASVGALKTAAADPEAFVRREAVKALGPVGSPEALSLAQRLASSDQDETVRKKAAIAAAQIQEQKAVADKQAQASEGSK